MAEPVIPQDGLRQLEELGAADIVVGIPSYNNARTIGHVVRAAQAGLAKYFPQFSALIVNSDGGSKDQTREVVMSARVEDSHLLMLSTPQSPVNRLSLAYHGIPGKGSAFRLIFQIAQKAGARACAVVDSDLRSITPEWIDLLVRPVLYAGYDFVAPYYHRHKYDGTITNSIVYPMTRALYGQRVRQPIGGDFGVSRALLKRYLARSDWETDVARYGIDIWMTTIALAERFRVCQSFLGAKLHDAKDPGADLSAMLHQVVGSIFLLMHEFEDVWQAREGSAPVDLFGFRFDVGLDPIAVNVERMLSQFARGTEDLAGIWSLALDAARIATLKGLAAGARANSSAFRFPDELWTGIIYDFARAHRDHPPERAHLLRSLTPLYLGRVASFVLETGPMVASEVEERIEALCTCFEEGKPRLVEAWNGRPAAPAAGRATGEKAQEVVL